MGEGAASGSPGNLLDVIRRRSPITRAELVSTTGLARSTISQRVDYLIAKGFVGEVGEAVSTGRSTSDHARLQRGVRHRARGRPRRHPFPPCGV